MGRKRLYTLDESVFDTIDTEESAYWLGFLYADAYIKTVPQYLCSLKLNEKDKDHLTKLQKFFNTDKPLFYRECKTPYGLAKSYQLDICSKPLISDLISKGCTNKKSLTLEFPLAHVPEKLVKDFIRGYFDGDGSVFIMNVTKKGKDYKYLGINICGTKEFLEVISRFVFGEVMCIYKEKRRATNTWNFKLAGNTRSVKLLNFIYKDANVCLDRKKQIYDAYTKEHLTFPLF